MLWPVGGRKAWLIAGSLQVPASKLRLVPVAAGGSFGSKFFMHKVPTLNATASRTFLVVICGFHGPRRKMMRS